MISYQHFFSCYIELGLKTDEATKKKVFFLSEIVFFQNLFFGYYGAIIFYGSQSAKPQPTSLTGRLIFDSSDNSL